LGFETKDRESVILLLREIALTTLPLLLTIASFPLLQSGGVEDLLARLEGKFSAERTAAESVWLESGPAYLKAPTTETLRPILAESPFIQEPLLRTFFGLPQEEPQRLLVLRALLRSMDTSGADSLSASIQELTPGELALAMPALVQKNGVLAEWAVSSFLDHDEPEFRFLALKNLLLYGNAALCSNWIQRLHISDAPAEQLGELLSSISERDSLPEQLQLPESLLSARHDSLVEGVLAILLAFPDKRSEAFAQEIALDLTRPAPVRSLAIQVIEKGAPLFRWRRSQREFVHFLKSNEEDALANSIAWAAHRLGEKTGTKFLSKDLKESTRKNPKDWRLRLSYGERLVELSEFSDAYKEYRKVVQDLEGTPAYRSIKRESWLFAARAACGARRMADGADWLSNARMSPRELEAYRDLPEFKYALSKSNFKRLFGIR
jgi:hypothetical protein